MQAAGEKTQAPPGQQARRGPGDHQKSAEEMAQTGRDHDE